MREKLSEVVCAVAFTALRQRAARYSVKEKLLVILIGVMPIFIAFMLGEESEGCWNFGVPAGENIPLLT